MIPELDEKALDEFILNSKFPVAVLFWGSWSQACREVEPILENLKRQFTRRLSFAKVNLGSNKEFGDKLNVRAVPTIVFFNEAGKQVTQISGVYSQADFTSKFNAALNML